MIELKQYWNLEKPTPTLRLSACHLLQMESSGVQRACLDSLALQLCPSVVPYPLPWANCTPSCSFLGRHFMVLASLNLEEGTISQLQLGFDLHVIGVPRVLWDFDTATWCLTSLAAWNQGTRVIKPQCDTFRVTQQNWKYHRCVCSFSFLNASVRGVHALKYWATSAAPFLNFLAAVPASWHAQFSRNSRWQLWEGNFTEEANSCQNNPLLTWFYS